MENREEQEPENNQAKHETAFENAVSNEELTITYINPRELKQSPLNFKVYLNSTETEDIITSIKTVGRILSPLLVNRPTMEIIAGNRRHTAAITLNLKTVPVIFIETYNDADAIEKIIHANISRESTYSIKANVARTLMEVIEVKREAGELDQLIADLPQTTEKNGWNSLHYVSKLVKVKPTSLSKLLYILNTDLSVFVDLDGGKISLDKAYKKTKQNATGVTKENKHELVKLYCETGKHWYTEKVPYTVESTATDDDTIPKSEYLEPIMPTYKKHEENNGFHDNKPDGEKLEAIVGDLSKPVEELQSEQSGLENTDQVTVNNDPVVLATESEESFNNNETIQAFE